MKNLSTILSAISLLGVAILSVLFFTQKNSSNSSSKSSKDSLGVSDFPVAYVNVDSLQKQYDFFKDIQNEMEAKSANLQSNLEAKARAFENEVVYYRQRAQSMSMDQAQSVQQTLQRKEQELMQEQESAKLKFAQEQQTKNDELYKRVTVYLQKYCKEKNYQYVFSYSKTSPIIFYAGSGLEITTDVVKALNEEYKLEKEKGKTEGTEKKEEKK